MLVKNLKKGGFAFYPSIGLGPSSANCKRAWVASNGSKEIEDKTRKQDIKLLFENEKKNDMKKNKKKGLNKKFVASTKVLKKSRRVNK